MNVIEFNQVKKQMGHFTLDIPKLEIKQGFITGFIGQNGAGKTTTMKLMMSLLRPDQGTIKIFGKEISDEHYLLRDAMGYVGDPTGYIEDSKIKDIQAMYSPFYTNWDDSLFKKYMKRFDLDTNKKVKELSQGQNKQLALSMVLARRPKLILLDEPTANLDPIVRNYILEILMEHMQDEEVSVFYSTHITTDLDKASDYITYIQKGKILFNEEKNVLSEQYYMVKGPKKLLTDQVRHLLIGCTQNSFGFEALTSQKEKLYGMLGSEAIYEKAVIEDIMLALERENGHV